jgi:hypothetical protein
VDEVALASYQPLPGWSAARLILRGAVSELGAVGCVIGFTVISGPGEPRPRSGNREDISEHLRQRQGT